MNVVMLPESAAIEGENDDFLFALLILVNWNCSVYHAIFVLLSSPTNIRGKRR